MSDAMTDAPSRGDVPEGARVVARAPGKVNLFLGVGDVRDHGFHELRTIYQSVDIWEEVTLTPAEEDSVTVEGTGAADVPTDDTNLAARAVATIRDLAGSEQPVAVRILKRIPVAGGMAGGSADAAAALVAANRLFGLGLGREHLEAYAADLGSDIPFCLRGDTVLGTGRGEQLVPLLRGELELHYVFVTANSGLSTPSVFRKLDRLREVSDPPRLGDPEEIISAIGSGDFAAFAASAGNDLQAAALSLKPELHDTLEALDGTGALVSMVSGSGPTCFGVYPTDSAALDAAARLAETTIGREHFVTTGPMGGAHVCDSSPAGR